jgi:tRNA1(Val) A37 N6-methylase TrmN6
MPTSMQSAPARCEFRGGIESYCQAAAAVLQPNGFFVVCENWFNNKRVWDGAKMSGLHIESVWPVIGRVGRREPLFAVYVMRKKENMKKLDGQCKDERVRHPIIVRGDDGKWTDQYADVMKEMSIPVL